MKIDRFALHLPAGFEWRAERIARMVAEELASIRGATELHSKRLVVPTIEVRSGDDDRKIAGRIARSIHGQITRS